MAATRHHATTALNDEKKKMLRMIRMHRMRKFYDFVEDFG